MGSLPWGAKPLRDFLYLGTLRVEIKLRIYLILLIFRGVRLKAYLYFGSLFEREIIEFHSTFSRHGNAQASLTLLIWLNEKVQKLSSKLFKNISDESDKSVVFIFYQINQINP